MAEIRIALNTTNPNPGNNEIVLYPTSNAGGELNVMGPDGQPKRLLTDLTTLNDITVSGALNKTGTSNQPNINLSNATTTSDGAMSRFDKEFLDDSTSENIANQLVKRDNSGNFAAGTITASLFEGPSSSTQLIPSLIGAISSDGTSNNTVLSTNIIDNTHIKTGANIALSKLAVNPVDRNNHTGSQSYTTISDFDGGIDNYLTNNKITTADISSTAGILMSQLEKDPSNRSTHFGPNPASALEDLPTEVNPIINNYLVNNPITNQEIETGTIEIGKLAFNPLDRAEHTGTQLVSTISNFTDEVEGAISTYLNNTPISNNDIDASAGIELTKLATNPLSRSNHTGTQTAATISNFESTARESIATVLDVTEDTTITVDNKYVLANPGVGAGAPITVTLPSANSTQAVITIKKIDSSVHTVTVEAASGELIEGATTFDLVNQYDTITIVSNKVGEWFIVSKITS